MPFYADLHIHSKYSRATSRDLDLEHNAFWARKKGVSLLGTGFYGRGTSCAERTMAEPWEPYGCRILGQTTTQLYTSPPTTANRRLPSPR